MALSDDLNADVYNIFKTDWKERNGEKVPEPEDVGLGNDAVKLDAAVMYADLAESTQLVKGYKWWFAAEVYKAYLHCAAKIISSEGGTITAYDGDRIMGIFIGNRKSNDATRTAFKIHAAVLEIINPAIKKTFTKTDFQLQHSVGVDTSELFAVRTGIRGSNDLVWIGRSANYAAKLSAYRATSHSVRITADVHKVLDKNLLNTGSGSACWEVDSGNPLDVTVYRSRCYVSV